MYIECRCIERKDAMDFQYVKYWDGWIFSDGPTRRVSVSAEFLLNVRGIDNHHGEPYTYTVCVFCGRDLPMPSDDGGDPWP